METYGTYTERMGKDIDRHGIYMECICGTCTKMMNSYGNAWNVYGTYMWNVYGTYEAMETYMERQCVWNVYMEGIWKHIMERIWHVWENIWNVYGTET